MGVQGWNRLLIEKGWLPSTQETTTTAKEQQQDDATSFWMNPNMLSQSHTSLEDRLVTIPRGSELHVDGFGFCFQIHRVAYARHCQRVLAKTNKKKKKFVAASKWKAWQVRQMIPSLLPNQLLTLVTKEIIQELQQKCQLKLIVYWDGEKRYATPNKSSSASELADSDQQIDDDEEEEGNGVPASFKHETEVIRYTQRSEEWSTLQDYCIHGKIPTGSLSAVEQDFPKNRLFISQIMHTLMTLRVPMQFCDEEADSIMARAATGNPKAYLLGRDSDFCFFPKVNYIPIHTLLKTSSNSLEAVVIRRDTLAESLNIPDSSMVELALLMGNDYVDNTIITSDGCVDLRVKKKGYSDHDDDEDFDEDDDDNDDDRRTMLLPTKKQLQNKNIKKRVSAFLRLLRYQGEGFQLQSPVSSIQECFVFVRRLYNLCDMSLYYNIMDSTGMVVREPSLIPAAIGMTVELAEEFKNATMDPQKGDKSLQDAVMRYLRIIQKHQENSPALLMDDDDTTPFPKVLTPSHILAFQLLSGERPSHAELDKEIIAADWRPNWRDVPAVYWIERLTSRIVHNVIEKHHQQQGRRPCSIPSPGDIFDPYQYHTFLQVAREKHVAVEEMPSEAVPGGVDESSIKLNTSELDKAENDNHHDQDHDSDPSKLPQTRSKLPVDEYQETILQSVRENRVTIIQGDTGCGKSSRIPVMLLNEPPPNSTQRQTKLFISQPRRIAAKALVERLRDVEPTLKDQIALRMGHGVREYETKQTRAWFVTTGYLVRLLANHPETFDDISIIIIDEVHERSVDTDILCLLCRRLLDQNEHIRLVLMSATLSADMYQEYFHVAQPPIQVGARRFPVKEVFLEDLPKEVRLSSKDAQRANDLLKDCLTMKCKRAPSMPYMEKVYSVAANLATVIGKPGTSVLIFVPGMNDIVAITELIESVAIPGIRFTCVPIHSDIPFEDQMLVFDASQVDEVKIVIATNAAESSLTLPEVDNVICLGLCKQIVYNEASHRQMLTPTWISRASATQRAGRTGRVRPGTVYRMYSRESYESHMESYEPGEMLRIPLDSVILMLKEMLSEEKVSEVLLTCLEPPDISTIDRSFQSLHKSHFITTPDDFCELTNLGKFVSSLGIDLALGSLIGLGIQMGVGAEAIQIAAILSFPKSPWVMSNPLIHPTGSFNDNTIKSYVSRCHFDGGVFSEPLAVMNLIWEYEHLSQREVLKWCKFHNIFPPRIRRLVSTTANLRKRVANFLSIADNRVEIERPPAQMPHGVITILRVIQVWVFHETIIEFNSKALQTFQKKCGTDSVSYGIQQGSDPIEEDQLKQILMPDRHPFALRGAIEVRQKGTFEVVPSTNGDFLTRLEQLVISYATEKVFGFFCVSTQDSLVVFTMQHSAAGEAVLDCLQRHDRKEENKTELKAVSSDGKASRGIGERSCGAWRVEKSSNKKHPNDSKVVLWSRLGFAVSTQEPKAAAKKQKKKLDSAKKDLKSISNSLEKLGRENDVKCLLLRFSVTKEEIVPGKNISFNIVSFGSSNGVLPVDMKDILGPLHTSTTKQIPGKQKIQFPICDNKPRIFRREKDVGSIPEPSMAGPSSWDQPLLKSIPEGARVISVLVSNRRRENIVKLEETKEGSADADIDSDDEGRDVVIHLDKTTNSSFRWKRFNADGAVYIDANSVPATAVPMNDPSALYGVCANTLEIRGGGLRAEGLTLIPQGRVFLLLSRFTFGLFQESNLEDGTLVDMSLQWIGSQLGKATSEDLSDRIEEAVEFHYSSMDLGETLECFPNKVAELLRIFDGVDGYEACPWNALSSNPFIRKNMTMHQRTFEQERRKKLSRRESSDDVDKKTNKLFSAKDDLNNDALAGNCCSSQITALDIPDSFSAVSLSQNEESELLSLFCDNTDSRNIGSCETLSKVLCKVRAGSGEGDNMALVASDWNIYSVQIESNDWFKAVFAPNDIGYAVPRHRNAPGWMKKDDQWLARPRTFADANECSPPRYRGPVLRKRSMRIAPNTEHVVFDSLNLAVQMEAAFWLECQFASKSRHWYEVSGGIAQMVGDLRARRSEPNKAKKANKKKSQQRAGNAKIKS